MSIADTLLVPVFPLEGALLFPRSRLPLHIFEPRYRDMIRDAMQGDRLIAMIQPRPTAANAIEGGGAPPALFDVGCLGHIADCEPLEDGRYNVELEGIGRFRLVREAAVTTAYRQIEIDRDAFADRDDEEPLAMIQRAELERESRRYADSLGYGVDWEAVSRLDDESLVNGIAQIAPLDVGSKQALLEAEGMADRADLLVQFMQFQRMAPGGADGPETLQ